MNLLTRSLLLLPLAIVIAKTQLKGIGASAVPTRTSISTSSNSSTGSTYQSVPYRINCGYTGGPYYDNQNRLWSIDNNKYYSGGASFRFSTCSGIDDPILYCSERYSKTFRYKIPVETNKTYTVNLYFVEFFHTTAGKRIFNVTVQNNLVAVNLDIFAKVGYRKPYIVTVPNIQITNTNKNEAWIQIDFYSSIDNAKISGIEIVEDDGKLYAPVRINVGSVSDWVDPISNVIWSADYSYYTGGAIGVYPDNVCNTTTKINGTQLNVLACTYRTTIQEFTYNIPIIPGSYIVKLLFVYVNTTASWSTTSINTCDVYIQDTLILENLDTVALVGYNNAFIISRYVVVASPSRFISIRFLAAMKFVSVNAIEIIASGQGSL